MRVKNFGWAFIASKLIKFLFFDNFFLDLAEFQELDIFSFFDFPNLDNFPDFLACSILFSLISNLLTSLLPLFFLEAGLLLSFLLEADLLPLFLLETSLSSDPVVFNIEVNGVTILLKP